MRRLPFRLEVRKWYHVVWHTCNRRSLFNMPARRRACEQELGRLLRSHGWNVGAVYVAAARLHVLAQPPVAAPREVVTREIKRLAALAARRVGAVSPWSRTLWDPGGWCAVMANAVSLRVVRRYLSERASAAGAPVMLDLSVHRISRRATGAPP
ncbi:MAG: transposase [Gemmatimonadales bacterium]